LQRLQEGAKQAYEDATCEASRRTWKLAFQASFATCPRPIEEDMKLGLQVTLDT